jgi:hypothetical protein
MVLSANRGKLHDVSVDCRHQAAVEGQRAAKLQERAPHSGSTVEHTEARTDPPCGYDPCVALDPSAEDSHSRGLYEQLP